MRETTDIKLHTLTMLSLRPLVRRLRHWWLRRARPCTRGRRKRSLLPEARSNGSFCTAMGLINMTDQPKVLRQSKARKHVASLGWSANY